MDDRKWERPDGYYKEYKTRRRGESHTTKLRIKVLVDLLSEICSPISLNEVHYLPSCDNPFWRGNVVTNMCDGFGGNWGNFAVNAADDTASITNPT